jgi:membrane protein implicated in regulation of membrane protease activity
MDVGQWWTIDIALPAILLVALIWLAIRRRSNRTTARTEASTRNLYRQEEERRREGTDQAEK